jgi:uncharacterized membrane protein
MINTVYKNGRPEFPLRVHTLRFAGIFTMKDSEVQAELKKFEEEHPERKILSWNKDIIRDAQHEAIEMMAEQAPVEPEKPVEPSEEPL